MDRSISCPRCAAPAGAGNAFCGRCGSPLDDAIRTAVSSGQVDVAPNAARVPERSTRSWVMTVGALVLTKPFAPSPETRTQTAELLQI